MALPLYSPDYNLTDEAFSKIKALVCKVEACSRDALVGAKGQMFCAVSLHAARGLFWARRLPFVGSATVKRVVRSSH